MAGKQNLINWLDAVWYGSRPVARTALLPLSALFCALSRRRKERLTARQHRFSVPVIVVGNITVGGTGKTPLIIYLANLLTAQGYRPGIVSRGYGAATSSDSIRSVTYQNKPVDVGDEALMMASRTGLPLVVGARRSQAVEFLLAQHDVDIVLSDDGLQHYHMARDLEIAVVDGERRYGNGLCLPAGPLREQPQRLQECDFVVVNGQPVAAGEYQMTVSGNWLVSVVNDKVFRPLSELTGQKVHVVTAIGNPQRFVSALTAAGLECIPHIYPDHYLFEPGEFQFNDGLPVVMTEKDAVKCQQFSPARVKHCWYLPVDAQLDADFDQAFLGRVATLLRHEHPV